jgi:hypothetical protein
MPKYLIVIKFTFNSTFYKLLLSLKVPVTCIAYELAKPTETKFKVSAKVDNLGVHMLVGPLRLIYLGRDFLFTGFRYKISSVQTKGPLKKD